MRGKQYKGSAWMDEGDVLVGTVSLEDHVVRFANETSVIDLAYDDLDLEVRSDAVELSNADQSDWTIRVDGHAVMADGGLRGRTAIRRQIEDYEDRKDGCKRLAVTALFFGGFIGLSALVGLMVDAAMPKMVALVPPSYEKEIALQAASEMGEYWDDYEDSNIVARLHGMVDRILPAEKRGDYEFKISLVDNPVPNAFALPAGRIFVFTGFLTMAKNPEEVAGVLAHEVAHVMRRHGLRKMIANAGPSVVFDRVLGSSRGFLGALAAGSNLLIQQNFSREYESEADDMAFDYLVAAGIDPRGLETFLNRLSVLEGDMDAFRSLMSHPPSPERVAHLKKRWRELKRPPAFTPLEELDWVPPERPNMLEQLLGL